MIVYVRSIYIRRSIIYREIENMKRQLQGIAIILLSILLTLSYGSYYVGDLSIAWSTVFVILGIAGLVLVFLPENDKK